MPNKINAIYGATLREKYNMLLSIIAIYVVYFDQQMHVCACVHMVKKYEKHSKIMKKVPFPSYVREAHVRCMKKNEEKSIKSTLKHLKYQK